MKRLNIKDYKGGWIVGDFDPAIVATDQFEVSVKNYEAGVAEPNHIHKIAQEITVIVSGKAKVNGEIYNAGEIFVVEPGEATRFETIEPTTTVVVKTPSLPNDKYIVED